MTFQVPNPNRIPPGAMVGPKGRQVPFALGTLPSAGNNGAFLIAPLIPGRTIYVLASDGGGWEHVSVSILQGGRFPTKAELDSGKVRIPTWAEMCMVKGIFWDAEDTVLQIHPPESAYVNWHSGCLHLWRKEREDFTGPPAWMVGPVKGEEPLNGEKIG